MKTIQKKMLVQVLLGFLLGRVSIYGMNPVAPAFCRGWSRITGCHYHITGDEYRICIGHGVGVWGRNVSAVAGCRLFEKAEDNGKDGTCRLFVGSGNMGHVGNKVFACSV